jgi:ATP-dependent helicase/nuclease subunit A
MKQAAKVHRELPFTMALPAHEVDPEIGEAGDEHVIVQGVIDCLLEEADGRLVLIDFKTDRIAAEPSPAVIDEMKRRYEEQIRLYVRAVEQILKTRKVAESYLYLLAGGVAVPVETDGRHQ